MFNFDRYNGYTTRNDVYLWVLKDYVDYNMNIHGGVYVERKDMVEKAGYIVRSKELVAKMATDGDFEADASASGALDGVSCKISKTNIGGSELKVYAVVADSCDYIYFGLSRDVHAIDKYIPAYFNVTYDGNGGSGTVTDSENYVAGEEVTLKAGTAFTAPSQKKFKEWNTASDGTGTSYASEGTLIIEDNITIYAIWEDDA